MFPEITANNNVRVSGISGIANGSLRGGWDALDRLYEKGYIGNPKSKAKSVVLTEEGEKLSQELFEKHFGVEEA